MSVISNNQLAGAAGQGGSGYQIDRSLRFNSGDSSYLSRTPSSAGNRKTWTWSGWLKRSGLGVLNQLFVTQSSGTAYTALYIDSSNKLRFEDYESSAQSQLFTTQVFRDVSAWQHIVVAVDTTQATASNRVKLYVNGQQVTEFDTETYMSQNRETYINNTVDTRIGGGQAANQFLNGYLAEVHFIDGQALAPSDFGEYDDNNVWQPKEFAGTYNTAASISSYPAVTISPSVVAYGNVSHVNGGGTYFYSQASSGAGSIKVEFSPPITGVTSIKYNGGGYSVNSAYNIKINGVDVFTNLSTNSSWAQASHTISSTDISSFEIYTANDGWSLYNLLFNDTSPSGTASLVNPAGVNGFRLDFSDNSSNAALGTDSSGVGTTLPGVSFDGSGDVVSSADHSDFTLGTNDWTIEYFVNPASFETYDVTVSKYGNSSYSWWHAFSSDGSLIFYLYDSSLNSVAVTSTTAFTANKWAHVAIVRDGDTLRMYVDGVQEDTTSITGWTVYDSTAAVTIGEDGDGNYDFSGVISNVRIVNGTCLYPNGTTFTVPSTPLTNVTNTKLLCCQSSSSATAATVSPNTLTTSGNPFATSKNDTAWTVNNLTASVSNPSYDSTHGSNITSTEAAKIFDSDDSTYGVATGDFVGFAYGGSSAKMKVENTSGSQVSFYIQPNVSNNAANSGTWGSQSAGTVSSNQWYIPANTTATATFTFPTTWDGDGRIYTSGNASSLRFYSMGASAAGIDSMIDTPTNYTATGSGNNGGNYATLNPLQNIGNDTFSDGNLKVVTNSLNYGTHTSTIATPLSGKWYAEVEIGSASSYSTVGLVAADSAFTTTSWPAALNGVCYYGNNGNKYIDTSASSYGASFGNGDVIGIAYDADNGTVIFYKNGVSQGTISSVPVREYFFGVSDFDFGSVTYYWNFGQRGSFAYTPPADHLALCTTNLPDPTIADGSTAFDAKTFTANNGSQSISLGFSPDLVWTKSRASAYDHQLFDILRGDDQELRPNTSDASRNLANSLTFDSSGFTIPSNNNNANYGSGGSVAWAWDGGDLVTTSDTTNYNQSQTWSNLVTGTLETSYGNSSATAPFDGDTGSSYPDGIRPTSGNYLSMNFGTTFANATSVKIYGFASLDGNTYAGSEENLKINGTAIGASEWSGSGQSSQTFSLSNGLTSLEWGYSSGSQSTGYLYLSGIEVDGKLLMNPGVIPAGGLNSSAYNQSQVWSSLGSGTPYNSGHDWDKAFDGIITTSTDVTFAASDATMTWTPSSPITVNTSVTLYIYNVTDGSSYGARVNGSYITGTNNYNIPVTLTAAELGGQLTSIQLTNSGLVGSYLGGVEVDGKLLADAINDSQTWSDSLTALSGSLTNPPNAFDTDESTYADSTAGFTLDLSGHTFGTGAHTIEVKSGGATSFTVNSYTSLTDPGGGGAKVWTGTHTGELTSLASSATGASVYYIKIDGKYLANPGQNFVPNVPSIASTCRANPSSGTSIVSYTGNGTAGAKVGHGLNSKPDLILLKTLGDTQNWMVYHSALGATKAVFLSTTDSVATSSVYFNNTEPTSSVFSLGTRAGINQNSDPMIAYCFSAVEGYSAFGKFSGNSSTDGPFQFCGFKPRFLLLKGITQARDWIILDTARDTGNVGDSYLHPNSSGAENTYAIADILSNGFKMRYSGGLANQTGEEYVWAAFASHPFKTARAR